MQVLVLVGSGVESLDDLGLSPCPESLDVLPGHRERGVVLNVLEAAEPEHHVGDETAGGYRLIFLHEQREALPPSTAIPTSLDRVRLRKESD
jgi:hypothetical protein